MAATVRDVALAAGVSTATVSRALRNFPNVDPTIRRRVIDAAERLDYVSSPAAAALSTGRTNTIGIITPYVSRWSFVRMLSGIDEALRGTSMDVLIYSLGDPSDPHPAPPHQRLRKRVDAFIVLSIAAESPDLEPIAQLDMPVALIGSSRPDVSSVAIDDRASAAMATQHLVDGGHSRVGLIYGREKDNPLVLEHQRYLGFRDALSDSDIQPLPEMQLPGDFTVHGGEQAMSRLLSLPAPPTAVFAMSDEMAFGAIQAMRAAGVRPGEDVAIIGFDGHEIDEVLDLSTISQPLEELGALAVRSVMTDLSSKTRTPSHQVLPTQLVIRGSSAAARREPSSY